MTLDVTHAILSLSVWLIYGGGVDSRTRRPDPGIVGVDVIESDEEPASSGTAARGREIVFRKDPVQPDRGIAHADFAVYGVTLGVT
jgi:hypothetical protein